MDTRRTMSRRLVGKVAHVTGATGGIGLAISELFLQEGATVHVTDIDPERAGRLWSTGSATAPASMCWMSPTRQAGQRLSRGSNGRVTS